VIILSFADDRNGERRRKSDGTIDRDDALPQRSRKKKRAEPTQLGDALRSIYDRTLNEDIPPEMLDLLGRLG